MKKLIILSFILLALTWCWFINDEEVQKTSINQNDQLVTTDNTWTTRKIKNIKRIKVLSDITNNTGNITQVQTNWDIITNQTSNDSQKTETKIWNSIEELAKIDINEVSLIDSWTIETWWIEDVSEEQISELVDILLEAWK